MSNKNTAYLDMELLRFTTAGSVDDGKSTLIGRLLYDSKAIFEDQWEAVEQASERRGEEHINLALVTDGLKAEREQGITIDVAYRYFHTPERKFIIADTPGHVQYTRNMVTGASTANLAIILVDARNGILEQTIRHSYIAALLQIPHVVVCLNKMDLVDYDEAVFKKIQEDFKNIQNFLNLQDTRFIPISALHGDNVVNKSENMPWYKGTSLIDLLNTIDIESDFDYHNPRFPVQYVIRPQSDEFHDYRGYAGRIAGGVFHPGDKVKVLPSGLSSKIKSIDTLEQHLEYGVTPQSVTLTLEDNIDISRGDMIVSEENEPFIAQEFEMMVCWLSEKPMLPRGKYILRHTTNEIKCMITEVKYKVNVNTVEKDYEDKSIGLNEIACVRVKATKPIFYDPYADNRTTGSVTFIDEGTYNTVAAGMLRHPDEQA